MYLVAIVQRDRFAEIARTHKCQEGLEQGLAQSQQLLEQAPFDCIGRTAVLGRLADPLGQTIQFRMHLRQLPLQEGGSVVMVFFRILCDHWLGLLAGGYVVVDPGYYKGGVFFDPQFTPGSAVYCTGYAERRSHPIAARLAKVGVPSEAIIFDDANLKSPLGGNSGNLI